MSYKKYSKRRVFEPLSCLNNCFIFVCIQTWILCITWGHIFLVNMRESCVCFKDTASLTEERKRKRKKWWGRVMLESKRFSSIQQQLHCSEINPIVLELKEECRLVSSTTSLEWNNSTCFICICNLILEKFKNKSLHLKWNDLMPELFPHVK